MSFFKKNSYTYSFEETPEELRNVLSSNIEKWKDFRLKSTVLTDERYEGFVTNNIFQIRRVSYNNMIYPEYHGVIENDNKGSLVTVTKKLSAGVRVMLIIFTILLFIAHLGILYISNPRDEQNVNKKIEMLFKKVSKENIK